MSSFFKRDIKKKNSKFRWNVILYLCIYIYLVFYILKNSYNLVIKKVWISQF